VRGLFRLYARAQGVRAVALFVDFSMNVVRRNAYTNDAAPSVSPSRLALEAGIVRADRETVELYGVDACAASTLVVLALRADKSTQLGADATHCIDELTLDAARRRIVYPEMWHIAHDLVFDVIAHVDVSPHRRATAAECARYERDKLPCMLLSDPVARWLGYREGDVIAETRTDCDLGTSLYFRRVVHHAVHPRDSARA